MKNKRNPPTRTRLTHGKTYSREYRIWWDMLNRCTKPKTRRYKDYGGRGITVCEKWRKFTGFYEDMGDRPTKDHSIERIDNEGNYCKENCVWGTRKEQYRNRRTNRYIVVDGERMIVTDVLIKYGLHVHYISYRAKKFNISYQEAFEKLVKK